MRAIIAPYDKTGAADLARGLIELGYEIYATGGTHRHLSEAGLEVRSISELSGFPEILDGRVKTLHPAVHGGLLARRDLPEHMAELEKHGLGTIDLVAVNLYPFVETVSRPDVNIEDALEQIDVATQTDDLLGDVEAVGRQHDLLVQARRVEQSCLLLELLGPLAQACTHRDLDLPGSPFQ